MPALDYMTFFNITLLAVEKNRFEYFVHKVRC